MEWGTGGTPHSSPHPLFSSYQPIHTLLTFPTALPVRATIIRQVDPCRSTRIVYIGYISISPSYISLQRKWVEGTWREIPYNLTIPHIQ